MLTKRFSLLGLAFLVLIVFAGCKKDNEDVSRTTLLTSGTWKITSVPIAPAEDIDGDGDNESDAFPFLASCFLDDVYTFQTNGSVELNEGASKCNPGDPQVDNSGTWAFVNEDKEFLYNGERATVIELSQSKFQIRFTDDTNTPASTLDFVFTKQ